MSAYLFAGWASEATQEGKNAFVEAVYLGTDVEAVMAAIRRDGAGWGHVESDSGHTALLRALMARRDELVVALLPFSDVNARAPHNPSSTNMGVTEVGGNFKGGFIINCELLQLL